MKPLGVCLLIILLGGALRPAYGEDFTGKSVGTIQLQGLSRASEQMIRAKLEVQTGQPYNARAVARDIHRLYDLGFFSTIKVDAAESAGAVNITYIFEEKKVIDEVKIIGAKKLKPRAIKSAIQWKEGDSFTTEGYDTERQAVLKLYQSKGFPNASVEIIVEDVGPSRVRITYSIVEGRKARIHNITFEGNSVLSERKLKKVLKTKQAWWFLGGAYDEAKLEADLQKVVETYGNYGRLEATVTGTDFNYTPSGKGLDIVIHVAEGPEYTVQEVVAAGNEVYDKDEVERIIKVHAGDVHNAGQVTEDANLVTKGYRDSGYINAVDTPQVTLDRDAKTTHIVHQVTEGQLKYVKEVKITGNSVTRDDVVRRQVTQIPGDRFDGNELKATERQLKNTRFFDDEKTRLTLENIEDDERFANLLVNVEEGKTGNFNFGAGYSTEEKMSGFAELKLNNFDITSWPSFSGGGQQFSARVSLGEKRNQYNVSFTDPEFMGNPIAVGADLFNEQVKDRGDVNYTEETKGGQLRFGKILSPYVSVRMALRYEDNTTSHLPWYVYNAFYSERGGSTTVSNIWGIDRNTTDSNRDPSTGSKHDLQIQIAGLGGDNEFVKIEHDSIWYKSVGKERKWVLSLRMREGWASPYGDSEFVPLSDRFFAGGTNTVRGYRTYSIGPKKREYLFWGKESAVGGELRIVDNLEAKYKLTDTFRLYTFIDAGGVWDDTSDFDFGDIKTSAGVGFGVDVPKIGPIRIDYGYPLNPDSDQGHSGKLHLITGIRF
ncbi:MAG: outer membrane protein assembly factor BamA [Candidatus Hydrogenedentes bacterium]|nr:outer membrane protein assembly factor BamA [Candidatus Hydrogenedentota bacterium]